MITEIIRHATRVGDRVVDISARCASTLIAAQETRRGFLGVSTCPRYVDAGIRLWQNHAGEEARHSSTGETFSERETRLDHLGANNE